MAQRYGAWGERQIWQNRVLMVIRSTFAIDEQGTIEVAEYDVKVKGHLDRLKERLAIAS